MKGCQVVIDLPRLDGGKISPQMVRDAWTLARKYDAAPAEIQLFPVDLLRPEDDPREGAIRVLFEVDGQSDFFALAHDVREFAVKYGALRCELRSWRVVLIPAPKEAGEMGSSGEDRPSSAAASSTIPAVWTPEMDEEFRAWLNGQPDPDGQTEKRSEAQRDGHSSAEDSPGNRTGGESGGQDGR